jgi:DNA-directed RNA polymerase subunit M/transcription elongation factor TFIIS
MHDRDCPRCGSLLPDEDEGVCQTCGYEYGRATTMMPALVVPPGADPSEEDLPEGLIMPTEAAPAMTPTGGQSAGSAEDAQRRKLVVILGVMILLLVVLAGMLLFLYLSP